MFCKLTRANKILTCPNEILTSANNLRGQDINFGTSLVLYLTSHRKLLFKVSVCCFGPGFVWLKTRLLYE